MGNVNAYYQYLNTKIYHYQVKFLSNVFTTSLLGGIPNELHVLESESAAEY